MIGKLHKMAKSYDLKPMEITSSENAPSWENTFYAAVGVINNKILVLARAQ